MLTPQLAQGEQGLHMPPLKLVRVPSGAALLPRPYSHANALLSCHAPLQQEAETAASHSACAQQRPVRVHALCFGSQDTP